MRESEHFATQQTVVDDTHKHMHSNNSHLNALQTQTEGGSAEVTMDKETCVQLPHC